MSKKLSPMEQRASSKVLGDLRKSTQDMMKGKMDGLKKVTVASDSKEGLKKGLEIAKKITGKSNGASDSQFDDIADELEEGSDEEEANESPEEEASESPEHESAEKSDGSEILPEEEAMTAEQLDNHIKALQALKFKKQ
jgi:hypothetical protein